VAISLYPRRCERKKRRPAAPRRIADAGGMTLPKLRRHVQIISPFQERLAVAVAAPHNVAPPPAV
jgi:hypothetical protein